MKCIQILNGKPCAAYAMHGTNYCFLHNPNISREIKLESQTRGGQNRNLKVNQPLSSINIKTSGDLMKLLVTTMNDVRQGNIDCRVANTLGYLAAITLKTYEITELEERLRHIENTINT